METILFPTQAANQANIYEDIFNRQKAYFASNITKSYEWRVDDLTEPGRSGERTKKTSKLFAGQRSEQTGSR